jgi:hypothetical protein
MSHEGNVEAIAVPFNSETVGAGMNVNSIARAINRELANRAYVGYLAIRRADIGDQLKGPDGVILLVAPRSEEPTDESPSA